MIGLVAKHVHLRAQRLIERRSGERPCLRKLAVHDVARHTLDPGDVEAECLGAGDIPWVRRHEQHLVRLDVEPRPDQRVGLRARLERFGRIDADDIVEQPIEAAVLGEVAEHRRTAVR